jgi:hypothetical protein
MHMTTQRSGQEEPFRRDKIERSMVGAGITQEIAQLDATDIKYRDGMTTSELRKRVIGAIKNRQPKAAKGYESHPRKSHTE